MQNLQKSKFILKCKNILVNGVLVRLRQTKKNNQISLRFELSEFYKIKNSDIQQLFSLSPSISSIKLTKKALILSYNKVDSTQCALLKPHKEYVPLYYKKTQTEFITVRGDYRRLNKGDSVRVDFKLEGTVKIESLSNNYIRVKKKDGVVCGMPSTLFSKLLNF